MNHKPRKRFGQNFLVDQAILKNMADAIQPQQTDHLIEIGPGTGALTKHLLNHCQHLDAIEIDRDLTALLEKQFSPQQLTVTAQDVLTVNFSEFTPQPLRIIGNLPYNISTPLIFHLLNYVTCIDDMHFLLQKEVVERITAEPDSKDYGRLSIMIQYSCETEYLFDVSKHAFNPAPKVESAFFRLKPHATLPYRAKNVATFSHMVQTCFNHRRKMLRTTLKEQYDLSHIDSQDIDLNKRPEQLSVAEFVKLANYYE
jgi:16S rRNA (adenine1518-N6/adenine1519-N6)-dimethyltransferase